MKGYNFTERVRAVIARAREEAALLQQEYVDTEHLLLAILSEGHDVAAAVIQNLGGDAEQMRAQIHAASTPDRSKVPDRTDLGFTSRAKKVLEFAMSEARQLNHNYVGTEHLLLGLLREEKGLAARTLREAGITLDAVRIETLMFLNEAAGPTGATVRMGTPLATFTAFSGGRSHGSLSSCGS